MTYVENDTDTEINELYTITSQTNLEISTLDSQKQNNINTNLITTSHYNIPSYRIEYLVNKNNTLTLNKTTDVSFCAILKNSVIGNNGSYVVGLFSSINKSLCNNIFYLMEQMFIL